MSGKLTRRVHCLHHIGILFVALYQEVSGFWPTVFSSQAFVLSRKKGMAWRRCQLLSSNWFGECRLQTWGFRCGMWVLSFQLWAPFGVHTHSPRLPHPPLKNSTKNNWSLWNCWMRVTPQTNIALEWCGGSPMSVQWAAGTGKPALSITLLNWGWQLVLFCEILVLFSFLFLLKRVTVGLYTLEKKRRTKK